MPDSKFRSSTNQRLTKSLFLEESYMDQSSVLYTLKDQDHNGFPSLYRLYMEMSDPTELEFARAYFDGWEHWLMIANASWFKPYIAKWREELDVQIRANALKSIRNVASDGFHKQSYEANKFLLLGGWKPQQGKDKVGRPSKEAIKSEAERLFENEKSINEDYKRILNG